MQKTISDRSRLSMFIILSAVIALVGCFSIPARASSTPSISGVVTNHDGKPLRGAKITLIAGYRLIARYTDQSGHYTISGLKPDSYEISATAYGYEVKSNKKNLSGDTKINFSLSPKWDVGQLTTAEWISAFPQTEDFLKLQAACMRCHNFGNLIKDKGMTADKWTDKILNMGDRFVTPKMSTETAAKIAVIATEYFGPNSPLPTRQNVQHVEISDDAIQATYREYFPPTKSLIHSIKPDLVGNVWFTEVDQKSGNLGRLDIATEKIQEIPMNAKWRYAAYPWVSRDGRVWLTQTSDKPDDNPLGEVNPKTGKITDYSTPDGRGCGSDLKDDPEGNIWCIENSMQLARFNPRTKKFTYFDVPKPPEIPAIYYRTMWVPAPDLTTPWTRAEAKTMSPIIHGIAPDSHGGVWYCLYDFGYLGLLDPETGKSKLYKIPDAGRIKAMEIDENDNVWFGDFLNHTLDKLDPKTGKVERYEAPTKYAAFYGEAFDGKGNLWLTDFNGSRVTKFDPATKKFTEFPLPRPDVMGRFFGLDAQGRIWYGDTNGKFGSVEPANAAPQTNSIKNATASIN